MDPPKPPSLSSATTGNNGGPPILDAPNHPTVHPISSRHSVTTPNLSKPPHRPEAHPRLHTQVSGMDTQTPTQTKSAAEAPSSDKEGNLPGVKGWKLSEEFKVRGERDGFPQSCGGDLSGDHVCAIITTCDEELQEHGTSDPATRNLMSRVASVNYITGTGTPAITNSTATPWCWHLSPTNVSRGTTPSQV